MNLELKSSKRTWGKVGSSEVAFKNIPGTQNAHIQISAA